MNNTQAESFLFSVLESVAFATRYEESGILVGVYYSTRALVLA